MIYSIYKEQKVLAYKIDMDPPSIIYITPQLEEALLEWDITVPPTIWLAINHPNLFYGINSFEKSTKLDIVHKFKLKPSKRIKIKYTLLGEKLAGLVQKKSGVNGLTWNKQSKVWVFQVSTGGSGKAKFIKSFKEHEFEEAKLFVKKWRNDNPKGPRA